MRSFMCVLILSTFDELAVYTKVCGFEFTTQNFVPVSVPNILYFFNDQIQVIALILQIWFLNTC